MLADLEREPEAAAGPFDVCVIGAGAAGVTIARELVRGGHRVCLAESGGMDFEARTQALYKGANLGHAYYALDEARLRFFGGTVAIWGGRCAALDAVDFRARPWVAHSGWPITRAQLAPWQERASALFGLDVGEWDDVWARCGLADPGFDPARIAAGLWRFDEEAGRFAAARAADLLAAPNLTVLLHANAVHLQVSENGAEIRHAEVRALGGASARIAARHFVLACGGIENARLLLASDDICRGGIGNGRDLVGRFFMEHPTGRIGTVRTDQPFRLWAALAKRYRAGGAPMAPVLRLAEAEQEARGALNSAVTFKLQRPPARGVALGNRLYHDIKHALHPDQTGRRLDRAYRGLRGWFHRGLRFPLERARARLGLSELTVIIRGEQAPNPDSRVVLSARRDALGQRRADLDWRLSAQDKHTARVLAGTLDGELRRLGLGSVEPAAWLAEPGEAWPLDPTVGNHPIAGYHHIGGTRMSDDPTRGVVDAGCRVHGVANLYVAGSSVFPTAGWANPTYPLTALALRLAARLDALLRAE